MPRHPVFQRATAVTRAGALLSPLFVAVTVAAVLIAKRQHPLAEVLAFQALAALVWGGFMVVVLGWSVTRRLDRATRLPARADRRDDPDARNKTVQLQLLFLVIWCALLVTLGPDRGVIGYAYAAPFLAWNLHRQLLAWEAEHNETIWWRSGIRARREYFIGS